MRHAEATLDRLDDAMARLADCADLLEEAMPGSEAQRDGTCCATWACVRNLIHRLRKRRDAMGDLARDWKEHLYYHRIAESIG